MQRKVFVLALLLYLSWGVLLLDLSNLFVYFLDRLKFLERALFDHQLIYLAISLHLFNSLDHIYFGLGILQR